MRLGVGGTPGAALRPPCSLPCQLYCGGQESGNPVTRLTHQGTWVPIALETSFPIYRRIQWDGWVVPCWQNQITDYYLP